VTLFVPGGQGENLVDRMRYIDRVAGTKIGFDYEQSGYFEACAHLRRQAERDAAYATWLESLPTVGSGDLAAEVLVVGHRGDQGHPARVAQAWAEQLDAHLELLTSRAVYTDAERVTNLLADFLD
jgi:hypothetical protein